MGNFFFVLLISILSTFILSLSHADNFSAQKRKAKTLNTYRKITKRTYEEPALGLPRDMTDEVIQRIDDAETLRALPLVNKSFHQAASSWKVKRHKRKTLLNHLIGEMVTLPPVTQADLDYLRDNHVDTRIRHLLPEFRVSRTMATIELYRVAMREFPNLKRSDISKYDREAILSTWKENRKLPLNYQTVEENLDLIDVLRSETGRDLFIMTDPENEYSIRGRELDENGNPTGDIIITRYPFGDGSSEDSVEDHAYMNLTAEWTVHGVDEVPAGADPLKFQNTFRLYHSIGNISSRSIEGTVRGGNYESNQWCLKLDYKQPYYGKVRAKGVGFRIAERVRSG